MLKFNFSFTKQSASSEDVNILTEVTETKTLEDSRSKVTFTKVTRINKYTKPKSSVKGTIHNASLGVMILSLLLTVALCFFKFKEIMNFLNN